ncbi:NAD(P)/FAD-dependent oxidoreductase [Roseibacillus ishigakijimensis]|uniref:NADH:ubiquinone reductase (non-electrogenic) n=1 Tax=Roseibacillus ishigakijimensis TaxID=454146 RepID=A0A934RLE1_9BACT|nr:NAD(P)/FAD-dependent oxidoreductase [Roseibacillus ishigakijimensis]MBK1833872.1 NAD(P)/FAD-dependent oxidoreductase [Roseibacillus ishigakijimensis]
MSSDPVKHVVVIGGGFGGLACARRLAKRDKFRVTLLDRRNHHLFQPLLYQVATTTLTGPDIARSLRGMFTGSDWIDVRYDEATGVDLEKKQVFLGSGVTLDYDAVVMAPGARTSFFGNDHWAEHVHQLKSLSDAIGIRKAVLRNLEFADQTEGEQQEILSTVIIVGGGPTGVELAGAFCDLVRRNLKRHYRRFDTSQQRIILIEGQDRLLAPFSPEQSRYTAEHLEKLGVEVRTQAFVSDIRSQTVVLKGGEELKAATIIWAAGVQAADLTRQIEPQPELTRGGLVKVAPDLSIPGYPSAFVVGDCAYLEQENGKPIPGQAPAAMQEGEHVASLITTTPLDKPRPTYPFRYTDKGQMAIVSKGSAVVEVKDWKPRGWLGWLIWLFVHVLFLVDFRNKVGVLMSWFWAYVKNVPGARVFTDASSENNLLTKGLIEPHPEDRAGKQ